MRAMKIALVQIEISIGNPRRNVQKHLDWVERAIDSGANLICFPECSLTGYTTEHAEAYALGFEDEAVESMTQLARSSGTAIGFGFIEMMEGREKPSVTYIVESAKRLVYRKTHLGSREKFAFEAGDELPVAQIAGVNLGVQLCWESHIPDIASTLRAQGAELILCPHAVGLGSERRIESWKRYLAARAFDNGVFVAACNALLRSEQEGLRGGGLAAFGPDGTLIASCTSSQEELLLVDIGGTLPRELPDGDMRTISYFDRRRPELYL